MKLPILVLSTVLSVVVSASAQTNPPASLGARIAFESVDYDFGKVDSGAMIKHDYIFTNTGDQVLEVSAVRPSCGCTAAGEWDKKVEPGKTGKIPVQFNSAGYGGQVHKTVSVSCNDSNQPNWTLNLNGTIWKLIDLAPAYAVFNLPAESQSNQTQTVRITNNGDQPVTVSDPACGNAAFKLDLKTVKEGKEYELQVTVIATNVSGTISAPVTLKTSSDKMPQLSLAAFAMMPPLIAVNPPQILLPAGLLTNATEFTVTISNNSTNPVALSDPQVNSEGVKLQLKEQQPGRLFSLTVSFPAGFQTQSPLQATVKSSNPKFPTVTIPVYQPAQPAAPSAAVPSSQGGSASVHSATTTASVISKQ